MKFVVEVADKKELDDIVSYLRGLALAVHPKDSKNILKLAEILYYAKELKEKK